MPISTKAVSSSIAAGALTLVSLSSCGDGTVYVRVNVDGIPTGTKTISIKSSVDTASYGEQLFDVSNGDKTLVAGMLLPAATRGTFKANISPLDASGKALQTCGVEYAGSGSRDILSDRDTTLNVSIALSYPDAGVSGNIYGVWGTGPSEVWVVGAGGLTARWNGCYWRRVESGTTVALRSIYGFASNNIWVVGGDSVNDANATVLHWDGVSWTSQPPSPTINGMLTGIWGLSSTYIWAIGKGPTGPILAKYPVNTANWSVYVDLSLTKPKNYVAISGLDDTKHTYAVGKSYDCGGGPTPPCTAQLSYLVPGSPDVWQHPNGGSALIGDLTALYNESATKTWIGGAGGFVASWDGTNDGKATPTLTNVTVAVSSLSTTLTGTGVTGIRSFPTASQPGPFVTVQTANNGSDLYRIDGMVPTKLTQPGQVDHPVNALWGTSPTDLWMVGNDGARFHYDGTTVKKYLAPL